MTGQHLKDWVLEHGCFAAYCAAVWCWFVIGFAVETGSIERAFLLGILVAASPFLSVLAVISLLRLLGVILLVCDFVGRGLR